MFYPLRPRTLKKPYKLKLLGICMVLFRIVFRKEIINGHKEKKMGSAAAGKNHTGCYEKCGRVSTY